MAQKNHRMVSCPHCGEAIKSTAPACPHCGSDEQTGWSEKTYMDGIDTDDDFDYDDAAVREFGPETRQPSWWRSWKAAVAAGILILSVLGYLLSIM